MPQIAQCEISVIYRLSVVGATKFARKGEPLPEYQDGIWEPLAVDNFRDSEMIPVVIVRSDGDLRFRAEFLPEIGIRLNLRNAEGVSTAIREGLFQITDVREVKLAEKEYIYQILVDRVGDMDPARLIYVVSHYMGN